MRPISIVIMVFAASMAVAVFFIVPLLMERRVEPQTVVQRLVGSGDVLVAARSVPAGTILKAGDVRWQRWPEDGLDASFFVRETGSTPQRDAVGRVVLRGLSAGEPITAARLLKPGDAGFLAAALTPGMRAASVKIDAILGDAGFIMPGDRVDLLLAERYPVHYTAEAGAGARPGQKQVSSVVLEDVRVLAIDQEMRDIDNKPKIGSTATLEVDLLQAQRVALAAHMGTLSLTLRSLARPEDPESRGGLVHDVDVSPYLASLNGRHTPASGLRVYRGGALSVAGQ